VRPFGVIEVGTVTPPMIWTSKKSTPFAASVSSAFVRGPPMPRDAPMRC
jgi:hypothetical protein